MGNTAGPAGTIAPVRMVLGLGSNLGSREALLRAAADMLAALPGVRELARSRIWQTAPIGPPQPDYLNAALLVHSSMSPVDLLARARIIETLLGRERRERWGPRTIDVDLLWAEGISLATRSLTLPHPRLAERPFALVPLLEVAPDARDPVTGELLASLPAAKEPPSTLPPVPFSEWGTFEPLEHTADEGFVARARDRADLLATSAEALGALVVDPATVAPARVVEVSVDAPGEDWSVDERLRSWLAEVLFHIDARRFALRRAVVFSDDAAGVRGALIGEELDETRHGVRGAVKAVTYHGLEVGPEPDGSWRAQVVVDV